jgi:hypothetical protein
MHNTGCSCQCSGQPDTHVCWPRVGMQRNWDLPSNTLVHKRTRLLCAYCAGSPVPYLSTNSYRNFRPCHKRGTHVPT